MPELLPKLISVQSPMMCAAVYVRKEMKVQDKLAFISSCIAKKDEIESKRGKGLGSIYPTPGGLKENVYWFMGEDAYIRQCEGESHLYHYLERNKKRIAGGACPVKHCRCGFANGAG